MEMKQLVRDNTVRFVKLRQGYAYYALRAPGGDDEYVFPVPLADVGEATLLAQDKAISFMRYIRQAMADGTLVRHAGA